MFVLFFYIFNWVCDINRDPYLALFCKLGTFV